MALKAIEAFSEPEYLSMKADPKKVTPSPQDTNQNLK